MGGRALHPMNFQENRMHDLNRTPLNRASLGWALLACALTLAEPAVSAEPSPAGGSAAAQAASSAGAANTPCAKATPWTKSSDCTWATARCALKFCATPWSNKTPMRLSKARPRCCWPMRSSPCPTTPNCCKNSWVRPCQWQSQPHQQPVHPWWKIAERPGCAILDAHRHWAAAEVTPCWEPKVF